MADSDPYRLILGRISGDRGRLQLSQTAVAERMVNLGFDDWRQQTVANVEKGKRRLTAEELLGLVEALETTVARLLAAVGVQLFAEMPSGSGHYMPGAEISRLANGGQGGAGVIRWKGNTLVRTEVPGKGEMSYTPEHGWMPSELSAAQRQYLAQLANRSIPVEDTLPSVVTAIVTSELGVLVGRRNDGKPPWTFIAGEQDAVQDESPADTAVREVKEETGLRIEAGEIIGERDHPRTGRHMIYMAARPTHGTEIIVGDEDELAEVRWVGLVEADELMAEYGMFGPVHEYLARERRGLMPKIRSYTAPDGTPRYWFRVDTGRSADGRRIQERQTFTRKREAEAELARITTERNRGTYVRPSRQTVGELIDEYLTTATFEKEAATARSYADALRCPRDRLGHARAQDVTRRDVEDLRDFMLREGRKIGGKAGTGLGPRSVILALGRLQAAFALAVADGRLARNPVEHVTRPRQQRKPRDIWTRDEVRSFLAEAAADRLHAAWRLSLYGLRRGEVTALRWDGYDRKAKTLGVSRSRVLVAGEIVEKTPKSENSVRVLPLDAAVVAALDELRKRQMAEGIAAAPAYRASGYIVTDELGAPVHPEWFTDEFHRIAKRAGVRRIRLHESRHTTLSLMEKAGVPVSIIAAWAGHYSAAFTMATYVHANPEDLAAGRDALASVYDTGRTS